MKYRSMSFARRIRKFWEDYNQKHGKGEGYMKAPFNEDNTMGQMIISILKENGWTYISAENAHVR